MEFCADNGVRIAFSVIGYLIFIIKIIVPLILIIMGIIDFAKALISSDEKSISDAISTFIRRFIAAVIIFFIPTILNFVLDLVDGANETLGSFTGCTDCLLKPTTCEKKALGEDLPVKENDTSGEQIEENETSTSGGKASEAINEVSQGTGSVAGNGAASIVENVKEGTANVAENVTSSTQETDSKTNANSTSSTKKSNSNSKSKKLLYTNFVIKIVEHLKIH